MKPLANRSKQIIISALLFAILLAGLLIRLKLLSASNLLPGINGGYYPLMTRVFLETGQLPFPDFPLVFWICAGFSALISSLGVAQDQAIIMVCKGVDMVIPVLAAIPVWLISRKITKDLRITGLLSAFVVLFFPFSYLLTGELIKNSVAIVWLLSFFAAILWFNEDQKRLPGMTLLISFVLLALTHYGSLLVGLMAIPLLLGHLLKRIWKKKGVVLMSSLILILFLNVPDEFGRMGRFISVVGNPFRLFEEPVLLYWLDGQKIFTPFIFGLGIFTHFFALLIFVFALQKKKGVYWSLMAVFLSSPVLGNEWYLRLLIMAHLPLVIAIIRIWDVARPAERLWINTLLITAIASSLFLGITGHKNPSIQTRELNDLQTIAEQHIVSTEDLVVAAHGKEWWAGWFLKCHIAQEQAVQRDDIDRFNRILAIRPTGVPQKGIRRAQMNFRQPEIGSTDQVLYKGESIILFEMNPLRILTKPEGKKPVTVGIIRKNPSGKYFVETALQTNPLLVNHENEKAFFRFLEGQPVLIFGQKKAFSLAIRVDSILNAPPGIQSTDY